MVRLVFLFVGGFGKQFPSVCAGRTAGFSLKSGRKVVSAVIAERVRYINDGHGSFFKYLFCLFYF